jgi:hypothetical protein
MDLKTLQDIPSWDWPEDADNVILKVLSDRKAPESDRLAAADLAVELTEMSDPFVNALLKIVRSGNESDELRGDVAIALGPILEEADIDGFDDEEGEPAITEKSFGTVQDTFQLLYADERVPKLVRRRILEASVRSPQEWHVDAIRTAYAQKDEDWRITAVFCMNYVRGFKKEILESLESSNEEIRRHAVSAAGIWEIEAAWPQVRRVLAASGTEKYLLLAAIDAAATIRPEDAQDLIGLYLDSEDEDISDAAMDALSMIEGSVAWEDDEELDEEDEDEEDDQ